MSIVPTKPPPTTTPRLHNGDHLTRDEFERRYFAMPPGTKAELIEGIVYMPSPVRHNNHGKPHAALVTFLGNYEWMTPGVSVGVESTIRLALDNEPQPDAVAFIEPDHGGRVVLNDGYIESATELVAEVAASSVSIDRNRKLQAYQKNGVREYILWRVEDEAIDWFVLRDGKYAPLSLVEGAYRSEALPGLWLDPVAMLARDFAQVMATLQLGLATPEYAAFAAKLAAAKA